MAWTQRYEGEEPQRINKWLAQSGVCSRREAEALIGRGLVSIDGERVDDAGRKITTGQTLTLADAAEAALTGALTVVMHKPVGYVSSQPEHGQTPAVRLITPANLWGEGEALTPGFDSRLAPTGRLDMDSRGLLILSEDGVVAKAVIGPQSRLDKAYEVRVTGEVTPKKLDLLSHGLELDGRRLKPAEVTPTGSHSFTIVLHEGRNRQIRRMCDLVELHVSDLFRTRIGPLHLHDLPAGRWRPLQPAERAALIAAA